MKYTKRQKEQIKRAIRADYVKHKPDVIGSYVILVVFLVIEFLIGVWIIIS